MLDLIPPSYESATDRDAWIIIAQYIPSSDLCAASLVSHRWHKLFMPFLWGDPASHFGTEDDAVYVALTRFRRTLKYARREVRALTHTLHLPPALSEIYDGPRPGWLRDILEYLPCLQSLMVSRLPYFDHNAMITLANNKHSGQYNVRLLLADHEPNTTSAGLAGILLCFPLLTFLDLSYTTPARDQSVLSSFSQLEYLQVLKLRGIGLKDTDAEFLANAIGVRVRFLDVRDNKLTDIAVRSLLQACFAPPRDAIQGGASRDGSFSGFRTHGPEWDLMKSPNLDELVLKVLAQPISRHPWIEDIPRRGLTHLYIANNDISVEGVASLLASSCLHALDVGTVNTANVVLKHSFSLKLGDHPGAEKLVPLLANVASENLVYLRAHHVVLTAQPLVKDVASTAAFLPELDASHAAQLNATVTHELPATTQPIHEFANTSAVMFEGVPSATALRRNPFAMYEDRDLPSMRRSCAFAPEDYRGEVNEDYSFSPGRTSNIGLNPHQEGRENPLPSISTTLAFEETPSLKSLEPLPRTSSTALPDNYHARVIQELLAKRPRNEPIPLKAGKGSRFPYLHPSHISHVETLVLTDVPSHIPPHSPIIHTLIRFIRACSNEALLATLQAGSDYSLPPGQARIRAEWQRSQSLFALRQIVLEITPTENPHRLTSWKSSNQNSSTGDRDSEALWAAAMDDFSFFGGEDCGILGNDPGKYSPMAVFNEKVSLVPSDDDSMLSSITSAAQGAPSSSVMTEQNQQRQYDVDLVAELAAFRRKKKTEYEQTVCRERERRTTSSEGTSSSFAMSSAQIALAHFVEGHWKGEIKVVRNPNPKARSVIVDMYDDSFEKGYFYT